MRKNSVSEPLCPPKVGYPFGTHFLATKKCSLERNSSFVSQLKEKLLHTGSCPGIQLQLCSKVLVPLCMELFLYLLILLCSGIERRVDVALRDMV